MLPTVPVGAGMVCSGDIWGRVIDGEAMLLSVWVIIWSAFDVGFVMEADGRSTDSRCGGVSLDEHPAEQASRSNTTAITKTR